MGIAPKVAPRRLELLDPNLAIFYRISVERGQIRGSLEIRNFHPPSAGVQGELKQDWSSSTGVPPQKKF